MKTPAEARTDCEKLFNISAPLRAAPKGLQPPQSPVILVEPEDREVPAGAAAAFTVLAQGTAPLKFAWRKNGKNIKVGDAQNDDNENEGVIESESEYSYIPLDLNESGAIIDCVISNEWGSATTEPAILTVNGSSHNIFQAKRGVTNEVRRAVALARAGIIEEEKDDPQEHFQPYQFSRGTKFRGVNPLHSVREFGSGGWKRKVGEKLERIYTAQKAPSHGMDADGYSHDHNFVTLFNGLSAASGISVVTPLKDPIHDGPREKTPSWILDNEKFRIFLRSRLPAEQQVLAGKELQEAVGLDCAILVKFYMRRREDQQIYEDHIQEFKQEKKQKKRQRRTSSGNAVTQRRLRLVKEGDRQFGTRKRWPRREIPDWVLYEGIFRDFLRSNLDDDVRENYVAQGGNVYHAAWFAYVILFDYFFKTYIDGEIYSAHQKEFESGRGKAECGITSPEGVRKYRLAMIAAGDRWWADQKLVQKAGRANYFKKVLSSMLPVSYR